MILLNQPWAVYERGLYVERRQAAARRALQFTIWALAWVSLGIGFGCIIASL